MILFIFLAMIFCHIVDDYYLQGWLANAKQKKWWQENAPQQLYKYDYIMALICHAFSWSFMIMLPIAIFLHFNLGWLYLAYPINLIIHAIVDDLKCNKHKINLIQDQIIHLTQISITTLCFMLSV